MVISLLLAPMLAFADEPDSEAVETFTIRGNGIDQEIVFSRADLEEMDLQKHTYSAINSFPTESTVYAEGVPLIDLLEMAGLTDEAQLLAFTASDGFGRTFTVEELLAPRFYFPGEGEKVEVPVMVCLLYSSESFDKLEQKELRLIMGQRASNEQNNPWFVRFLADVEVKTEDPDIWPEVTFERAFEPEGLLLHLRHASFDSVKIYYTTDGTTPTVDSAMYNISATRFQPELNKPIPIETETEVRAIAIGPGKADSAVSSITISPDDPMFTDIDGYDWAKQAIEALAAEGIIKGVGDSFFDPAGNLTRAMLVTIIGLVLEDEDAAEVETPDDAQELVFPDVDYDSWYGKHVIWAVSNGFVNGFPDGTFRPEGIVTVQELIVLAVSAGFPDAELSEEFEAIEFPGVDSWALPYFKLAEMNGILLRDYIAVETDDGIYVDGPQQATRAQAAVIAYGLWSQG